MVFFGVLIYLNGERYENGGLWKNICFIVRKCIDVVMYFC